MARIDVRSKLCWQLDRGPIVYHGWSRPSCGRYMDHLASDHSIGTANPCRGHLPVEVINPSAGELLWPGSLPSGRWRQGLTEDMAARIDGGHGSKD